MTWNELQTMHKKQDAYWLRDLARKCQYDVDLMCAGFPGGRPRLTYFFIDRVGMSVATLKAEDKLNAQIQE